MAVSSIARAALACPLVQLCLALKAPDPAGGQLAAPLPDGALPVLQRRYIYLSQGRADPPEWLVEAAGRPDSDAVFLAYAPAARSGPVGRVRMIDGQNTTWTTGRNALYQEASRIQRQQGWSHEYLVFADEDTGLRTEGFEKLHKRLSAMQPAVAAIGFRNRCDVIPCGGDVDANFNAVHATAAPLFLPYDSAFDNQTWWGSQNILIALLMGSAPDYVVEFHDIKFAARRTRQHAKYPRGMLEVDVLVDHLAPKVSPCFRSRLLAMKDDIRQVGRGRTCRSCSSLAGVCSSKGLCREFDQQPRDYAKLVQCKPFG